MTTPSSSQLVFFQSVPRPPLCAGPSLNPILVRVCSIHSLAKALKNSRSSVENHPSPPLLGSNNSMNSSIVTLNSSASVLLTHATAWTSAVSQSSLMIISKVAREYSNIFSNVIDPHCSSRLPPPPPICSILIDSSIRSGDWLTSLNGTEAIDNTIRKAISGDDDRPPIDVSCKAIRHDSIVTYQMFRAA